jgi:hypothetical protein
VASTCAIITCNAGYADCNGTYSDGCETNLNTNASHCGMCGVVCSAPTPNCTAGTCGP